MLTKEECYIALNDMYDSTLLSKDDCKGNCKILAQLIEEHFYNPPLKFEELKPNMWVWDIKRKQWMQVYSGSYVMHGEKWLDVYTVGYDEVEDIKYGDDRFYRKECYHE